MYAVKIDSKGCPFCWHPHHPICKGKIGVVIDAGYDNPNRQTGKIVSFPGEEGQCHVPYLYFTVRKYVPQRIKEYMTYLALSGNNRVLPQKYPS